MENICEKLGNELAKQLCHVTKDIIVENAKNWERAEDSTPEWLSRAFSAARDLLNCGAELEAAECIAAICDAAKDQTGVVRMRVLSTAVDLLLGIGYRPQSAPFSAIPGDD